jgi:hypothetical protein
MNKQAQIILSNCLTLVTTVAPPQNATAEHLLIKACEIMNRLVVDSVRSYNQYRYQHGSCVFV